MIRIPLSVIASGLFVIALVAAGCASNRTTTHMKRWENMAPAGAPVDMRLVLECEDTNSTRIVGTGNNETTATTACGTATTSATEDTGISDNAKDLGVLGIGVAAKNLRPGGQLEGAIADRLPGAAPATPAPAEP